MFASEYGWTLDYIQNNLTLHEETRLMFAILTRKGVKCFKTHHTYVKPTVSLAERVNQINQQLDTTPELEGIIF